MKTLIIVDVQPEYQKGFSFDMHDFVSFVDGFDCQGLLVLYNGEDTLNMISKSDLKEWYEKHGSEYLSYATYHDKGYAFFRSCMDHGFADEVVIPFIRYMWENDVTDSRNIDWEEIDKLILTSPNVWSQELAEFLRQEQDCIFIPDLMNIINDISGELYLVGGGVSECLREVEIALRALERDYTILNNYTY